MSDSGTEYVETLEIEQRKLSRNSNGHNFSHRCLIRTKRLSQILRLNRTTFLNLVHSNVGDGTMIINNFLQVYKTEIFWFVNFIFSINYSTCFSFVFTFIYLKKKCVFSSSLVSYTSFWLSILFSNVTIFWF